MNEVEEKVVYPYFNLLDNRVEKLLYIFLVILVVLFISVSFYVNSSDIGRDCAQISCHMANGLEISNTSDNAPASSLR